MFLIVFIAVIVIIGTILGLYYAKNSTKTLFIILLVIVLISSISSILVAAGFGLLKISQDVYRYGYNLIKEKKNPRDVETKVNLRLKLLDFLVNQDSIIRNKFVNVDDSKIYGLSGIELTGIRVDQLRGRQILYNQRIDLLNTYKTNSKIVRKQLTEYYDFCSSVYNLARLTSVIKDLITEQTRISKSGGSYKYIGSKNDELLNAANNFILEQFSRYRSEKKFFGYDENYNVLSLIGENSSEISYIIAHQDQFSAHEYIKRLDIIKLLFVNTALNKAIELGDEEGCMLLRTLINDCDPTYSLNHYPALTINNLNKLNLEFVFDKPYDFKALENFMKLNSFVKSEPDLFNRKVIFFHYGQNTESLKFFYPFFYSWLGDSLHNKQPLVINELIIKDLEKNMPHRNAKDYVYDFKALLFN